VRVTEAAESKHGEARRPDPVWLVAIAALALLFLAVSVQKIWAGDFWGQLRTGQLILERGALPHADEYTFTSAGREVREVRWLYCVLIALGWRIGAWFLCLATAAVLGVVWAVVIVPARRAMASPVSILIVGLGLVAGAGRWVLRPELATDVFVAVFLVMLHGLWDTGTLRLSWVRGAVPCLAANRMTVLVMSQILWVNLHSVPILGPALAWLFLGSALGERALKAVWPGAPVGRRSTGAIWRFAAIAAAVTGACWVNPYFHRGAIFGFEMWREYQRGSIVSEMLRELQSPFSVPFEGWTWDFWVAAVLALATTVLCVLNRRRMGVARWGVLALALYLAGSGVRNTSLLAVMGVWLSLRCVSDLKEHGWELHVGVARAISALTAVAALAMAWWVATDRAWIAINAPRETGLGVVEWDVASGAADFVVASGADPRVYNSMRDGHFLTWRSGGKIKVFVDGRTDVPTEAFYREYMSLNSRTFAAIWDKWHINTAVVPVRGFEQSIRVLMKSPVWVLVYMDHRNMVFVRQRPEQADLVPKFRVDPAKVWPVPQEPRERIESWKAAIGGRVRPWYLSGMAESFLAIGSLTNAEAYLRKTLEVSPRHERALAELAALLRFAGRAAEGDAVYAKLKTKSEWAQYSERALVGYFTDAGRLEEAAAAMQRAVDAGATEPALFVSLGDWNFEHKAYAAARSDYERAVKGGTDAAAEWKKLGYACEQTSDPAAAEVAYRRSLARDGDQHEVWYLLGMVQARRGDRAGARVSLERAVKIKPDFAPAQRALEGLK
jgi:Flp pilus assembly protein TadD